MRVSPAVAAVTLLGLTSACLFQRDERVYFRLHGTVTNSDEVGIEHVVVTLSQRFTETEAELPTPRGEVVTDAVGAYDFGRQELRDREGKPLLEGTFRLAFRPETPVYRTAGRELVIAYDNTYTIDVTLERR